MYQKCANQNLQRIGFKIWCRPVRGKFVSKVLKLEPLKDRVQNLVPSLANVNGLRFVGDDDALFLLVQSSLHPEEKVPSIDTTFLFEAEGFSGKFSSPNCFKREGSSSLASSMSKDMGSSLGGTKAWSHGGSWMQNLQ